MCLAVPVEVTGRFERDGVPMALVDFGGVRREACLVYEPDARVGSFVVVHAGFAVSVVGAEDASRSYELLAQVARMG